MRVGVPKEIKIHEYRVGLVPGSVRELVQHGHEVLVETRRGAGIGYDDAAYVAAGARIGRYRGCGIRKRRDDREGEGAAAGRMRHAARSGQILFTYLHLAADKDQTERLMDAGITASPMRR